MREIRWVWKEGARFSIKAEVVAETIENIKRRLGRDPEAKEIVEEAQSKRSPLHSVLFAVDDATAAQSFREQLARTMLNSLRCIVVSVEGKEVEQLGYVNVRFKEETVEGEQNRSVYMRTTDAMQVEEYRSYVIEDALRYARGFARRVKELKEFAEVILAIEKVDAKYTAEKEARQKAQKRKEERQLEPVGK